MNIFSLTIRPAQGPLGTCREPACNLSLSTGSKPFPSSCTWLSAAFGLFPPGHLQRAASFPSSWLCPEQWELLSFFSLTLKVIPLLWLHHSPCIQPRDGEGLETLVHTRGGDHGTIPEASYPEGFWGF